MILILITASCYNENKIVADIPDPLLSEDQIVELLTDIQTAEAVMAYNRLQRENTDQHFKDSLFKKVFDHYNLTADEVNENLDYYNNFPGQMEKIYEKVLSNMSKRQSEIDEESKNDAGEEE